VSAIVVVWLGTAEARAAHEPDLASWASARAVAIEEPAPDRKERLAAHDDGAAAHIEALLAEARGATYSTDPVAAEATLDAAEGLIREHADLPEAAWLMAEAWRERAGLLRARSPDVAARLDARAAALEGARARAFTDARAPEEKNGKLHPPAGPIAPPVPGSPEGAAAAVALGGPLPTDDVDVDGVESQSPFALPEGPHHVRVLRRGRLAWAGWVTAAGASAVAAPVPPAAPCSETDLVDVAAAGPSTATLRLVLCPRFAVARPDSAGRIEVAVCEHSSCGPWLPWSRTWGASFEGPAQPAWPARPSHEWIFWTAVGAAATVVGGLVLWQEGAFERQGPTRETFTFVPPAPPAR
jgi:hypothetical protein